MKVAIKVRRIMSHVRIDKSENAAPSKIFRKKWGSYTHKRRHHLLPELSIARPSDTRKSIQTGTTSTCGKRSSNQVGSRLAAMYFRSCEGGMLALQGKKNNFVNLKKVLVI